MPTFDGSSTSTLRSWREELFAFFLKYSISKREAVDFAVLHLEGEARDWWFSHLSHMKVSTYVDFIQRLNKRFGRKKPETYHIVTSPIIKEIVNEDTK